MLNLGAVSQRHLFESARSWIGEEEPSGPALVVAQAAVEVAFETVIDFAMQMLLVHDPLREWVNTAAVRSWSPDNERVQALWTALSGDRITEASSWPSYKSGLKRRHAFAHWAAPVSAEEARQFVEAAAQLVAHVVDVMERAFPDPVEAP
jgi:hypothetical protein